jgi:hypothetical protein
LQPLLTRHNPKQRLRGGRGIGTGEQSSESGGGNCELHSDVSCGAGTSQLFFQLFSKWRDAQNTKRKFILTQNYTPSLNFHQVRSGT